MKACDLIAFEEAIANDFNAGLIRHPIHLTSGNEDVLIDIFKGIRPNDWVCGSWRMHYHCLLKGVPPEELEAAIYRGDGISLCFPEYRIVSSAIVGGIVSIAMGIALGIEMQGGDEKVHCFLGDMTACTGTFFESRLYARNHDLPIRWIIEDNGKSVMTDTEAVWGGRLQIDGPDIITYKYKSKWPHAGAGKRVEF